MSKKNNKKSSRFRQWCNGQPYCLSFCRNWFAGIVTGYGTQRILPEDAKPAERNKIVNDALTAAIKIESFAGVYIKM